MPRLPETSSCDLRARWPCSSCIASEAGSHARCRCSRRTGRDWPSAPAARPFWSSRAASKQRMGDFQAAVGQVGHQLRDPLACRPWPRCARSIAFLKRAVAISSIVRVILRMLRIDLRRLSSARALAMIQYQVFDVIDGSVVNRELRLISRVSRLVPLRLELRLERGDRASQLRFECRRPASLSVDDLVADVGLLVAHERQELLLPRRHVVARRPCPR